MSQTWLDEPRWLLVVTQDYAEAFSEVNHANKATLIFLSVSAFSILGVAILITKYMIGVIKNRDVEAEQLNRQLIQTGKLAAIGELAAGVAHEINNPLAIILTEKQLLLDLQGNSPQLDPLFLEQFLDSMSQIEIQIQRCKRITQNLLRFSRRTESVVESLDLNAFLSEVVELMEREAKTCGITIKCLFEEDLPLIRTDPSQLQQVFLNLITNAIDAHNENPSGTITIGTRLDGHKQGIEVTFADTGSGISPENMEKIFDPFFTTKPVGRGTGLGLSICLSIIKRLGGTIKVKSEPGKGSQFTLVFPYDPPRELLNSIGGESAASDSPYVYPERRIQNGRNKDLACGR